MAQNRPPLYMVTWRCTRRCVGNCIYCSYVPKFAKDDEVNTETGKKIVDEMHNFGAKWFGISGGEPLVREDIFEIIEHAKKTYGMEVSLITSGFAFDQKRLDLLTKYEVHTAVSIDGDKATNDVVRGTGSYDKATYAMKKLGERGLLDCIVTTMNKYNINVLEHTCQLAAEYGGKMVVYHNLVPVGRASDNMLDLAPTAEQYEVALNQLYDYELKYNHNKKNNNFRVNVYSPFYARIVKQRNPARFWDWFTNEFLGKCTIGGDYIGVTENGDYRPCGFHEGYRLANVKDKSLKTAWDELQTNPLHLKLRDKSQIKGKCGICEYREICGGCRTRAEFYTGDLFETDPACAYIPQIMRENAEILQKKQ